MKSRTLKLVLSSIIYAVIIIIAGASYAYFSNFSESESLEGFNFEKTLVVSSDECTINDEDCFKLEYDFKNNSVISKNIKIENKGDSVIGYKLVFETINNTFNENDITYVLKDSKGNIVTSETTLPSGIYNDNTVIYDYLIDSSEVHNYELTIMYNGDISNLNDSTNTLKVKLDLLEY